jgi:hypothetical protein
MAEYRPDIQGSIRGTARIFRFSVASRSAVGCTRFLSIAVPRGGGRGTDLLHPSGANVKNMQALPPLPHTPSWLGALIRDSFVVCFVD